MNQQGGAGGAGAAQKQQLVPVQTCKLPTPRSLTLTETRESVTTWLDVLENYLLRDANSARFVTPGSVWNHNEENYGQVAEGPGTKLRRTAPEMEASLREMFRTVSSFFPFGFLKRKFPLSTSWPNMKTMIYEAYNLQLNTSSLLAYSEVKRTPDENYYIYFSRLYDYFYQHLAPANATGGGHVAPPGGDTMSLSQANMVAIIWLEKIDKRLLPLIRQEYGVELRDGHTQLVELVPRLAQDMDNLRAKLDTVTVNRFTKSEEKEKFKGGSGRFRNKKRNNDGKEFKPRGRDQLHCPHCKYLQKEMEVEIPYDHSPTDCTRKRVHVRAVAGAKKVEELSESEEYHSETEETTAEGETEDMKQNQTTNSSFQMTETVTEGEEDNHETILSSVPHVFPEIITDISTSPSVSEKTKKDVLLLNRVVTRIRKIVPTQARSASLLGEYQGTPFVNIIDGGAEVNCLDLDLVERLKIPYIPTDLRAEAVGEQQIDLAGVTSTDFIFHADFYGKPAIPINMQRAAVVRNLGSDTLVGEPAKRKNRLDVLSHEELVTIRYKGEKYVQQYHFPHKRLFRVARAKFTEIIEPGRSWTCKIPRQLQGEIFLVAVRRNHPVWFKQGLYTAHEGEISLKNITDLPVSIRRKECPAEIRSCSEIEVYRVTQKEKIFNDKKVENPAKEKISLQRVVDTPSSEFRYKEFRNPDVDPPQPVPEIILDPDNVMPSWAKKEIRDITNEFSDVFTKRPGKYNGHYGKVDNSIKFSTPPAAGTKVYMPDYSDDLRKKMGDLMDRLIDYGVLQFPEDVGVTPEVVCSSLILPKAEEGEFRIVTDFSKVNKHICPYPSTSPTFSDAKKLLARKKYFIHLDLSNFFFQAGLENKDCQYLCTYHPFRGVLCYVVSPQGLRNSSEQGYEILNRVYGDMTRQDQLARLMDSLMPVGNTWREIIDSYRETLCRARKAGLTFKPGKVVVCPQKTVLFGWQLTGTEWTPTTHTTSALSACKTPSTVKALRSFLGSFKQFSECVQSYGAILHGLEQLVGGRSSAERIDWNEENMALFEKAKEATKDIKGIHVPVPSDKLHTYSDYSQDTKAVGGRLEIVRVINGEVQKLHGGYFSVVLDKYKQKWSPCEAEACGVRLVLEHFAPYIRENKSVTIHHTDNLPTVQAWRRCLQGQFSNSSRISTFLTNLSALPVELEYKPGRLMHSADFLSRNPVQCGEKQRCQICTFAGDWQKLGDNSAQIKSVTVKDVLEGRTIMPLIQLKTWLGQQLSDAPHDALKKLINTGQHPDRRKTKGDHTVVKKMFNLYQAGDLTIKKDGLVMVKARDGHFDGWVISVPPALMSGLTFTLHIKLGHPSKGQLQALMSRYFWSHGQGRVIQTVTENCVQCRSMAQLPAEFQQDVTEKVETFGAHFAVDVMERNTQKIFIAREKLSQMTWLTLIPDQTMASLRTAITTTILPWASPTGAVIRCDGATGFVALCKEMQQQDSIFNQFKVSLDVGRSNNINKNPVAENAVREVEKEIGKYKPSVHHVTEEDLIIVGKIINERIRDRGMASREILMRRDLATNQPKNIRDSDLSTEQFERRTKANQRQQEKREKNTEELDYHVGDTVYIKGQKTKHNARQKYIITRFVQDRVVVQKVESRFANKEYFLYKHEIIPINANSNELFKKVKETFEEVEREEDIREGSLEKETRMMEEKPDVKKKKGRPKKKEETTTNTVEKKAVEEEPDGRQRRKAARKARESWNTKINNGRTFEERKKEQARIFNPAGYFDDDDVTETLVRQKIINCGHPDIRDWHIPMDNFVFIDMPESPLHQWWNMIEEEPTHHPIRDPVLFPPEFDVYVDQLTADGEDSESSSEISDNNNKTVLEVQQTFPPPLTAEQEADLDKKNVRCRNIKQPTVRVLEELNLGTAKRIYINRMVESAKTDGAAASPTSPPSVSSRISRSSPPRPASLSEYDADDEGALRGAAALPTTSTPTCPASLSGSQLTRNPHNTSHIKPDMSEVVNLDNLADLPTAVKPQSIRKSGRKTKVPQHLNDFRL